MLIYEFFTAFAVSVFFTTVVFLLSRELLYHDIIYLFLYLLLTIWAGGLWIRPFGPMIGNIFIAPYVVIGLIMALIFLVIGHQKPPVGRQ